MTCKPLAGQQPAVVARLAFSMQKDSGKFFGAAMMFGFGIIAVYRWHQTQLLFFLLLMLRDFAASYYFLKRNSSNEQASVAPRILAYVSSAMPLLYFGPLEPTKALLLGADLLSIAGFLLVAFATLDLGTSIGVAPANRGLVKTGIYRHLKHPMYTGYTISEIGMTLINPWNLILLIVSCSLYWFRATLENQVLRSKSL